MPTVLLVTQDLQRAGAQRQCVELALGLGNLPDWHVEVLALEKGGPLESVLLRERIPIHHISRNWRWDLGPAMRVASLVCRGRFEVVHSFMFLPNFYVRLSRLSHRPSLIVSSHRSTKIRGRFRHFAEVLMAPLCDFIIANSESGRNYLISAGVAPDHVVVVRNGLDLDRFHVPGRSSRHPRTAGIRIGMIARMEADKDQMGLVTAFQQVLRHHPTARLVLGGGGSRLAQVRQLVDSQGLQGSVEFLGEVERPEDIYPTLDIYAQPSLAAEGTSNSLIEAMASGLPVVATDSGGNSEVVVHGQTGLLVPPRDASTLGNALHSLLADSAEAQRMGEAGAARAKALFSRERMVADTVAAYTSKVRARKGSDWLR